MSTVRLDGFNNPAAKKIWEILNRAEVDFSNGVTVKKPLSTSDIDEMIEVSTNARGQDKTEAVAAQSEILAQFRNYLPANDSKLMTHVDSFLGSSETFNKNFSPIERTRLLKGMAEGLQFHGMTHSTDYREKTDDVVPYGFNVSPEAEAKVHNIIAEKIEAVHRPISFLYGIDPGPPMQVNTIHRGNDVYGWLVRGDNAAVIIDNSGDELAIET